jgi:hypothetical protein
MGRRRDVENTVNRIRCCDRRAPPASQLKKHRMSHGARPGAEELLALVRSPSSRTEDVTNAILTATAMVGSRQYESILVAAIELNRSAALFGAISACVSAMDSAAEKPDWMPSPANIRGLAIRMRGAAPAESDVASARALLHRAGAPQSMPVPDALVELAKRVEQSGTSAPSKAAFHCANALREVAQRHLHTLRGPEALEWIRTAFHFFDRLARCKGGSGRNAVRSMCEAMSYAYIKCAAAVPDSAAAILGMAQAAAGLPAFALASLFSGMAKTAHFHSRWLVRSLQDAARDKLEPIWPAVLSTLRRMWAAEDGGHANTKDIIVEALCDWIKLGLLPPSRDEYEWVLNIAMANAEHSRAIIKSMCGVISTATDSHSAFAAMLVAAAPRSPDDLVVAIVCARFDDVIAKRSVGADVSAAIITRLVKSIASEQRRLAAESIQSFLRICKAAKDAGEDAIAFIRPIAIGDAATNLLFQISKPVTHLSLSIQFKQLASEAAQAAIDALTFIDAHIAPGRIWAQIATFIEHAIASLRDAAKQAYIASAIDAFNRHAPASRRSDKRSASASVAAAAAASADDEGDEDDDGDEDEDGDDDDEDGDDEDDVDADEKRATRSPACPLLMLDAILSAAESVYNSPGSAHPDDVTSRILRGAMDIAQSSPLREHRLLQQSSIGLLSAMCGWASEHQILAPHIALLLLGSSSDAVVSRWSQLRGLRLLASGKGAVALASDGAFVDLLIAKSATDESFDLLYVVARLAAATPNAALRAEISRVASSAAAFFDSTASAGLLRECADSIRPVLSIVEGMGSREFEAPAGAEHPLVSLARLFMPRLARVITACSPDSPCVDDLSEIVSTLIGAFIKSCDIAWAPMLNDTIALAIEGLRTVRDLSFLDVISTCVTTFGGTSAETDAALLEAVSRASTVARADSPLLFERQVDMFAAAIDEIPAAACAPPFRDCISAIYAFISGTFSDSTSSMWPSVSTLTNALLRALSSDASRENARATISPWCAFIASCVCTYIVDCGTNDDFSFDDREPGDLFADIAIAVPAERANMCAAIESICRHSSKILQDVIASRLHALRDAMFGAAPDRTDISRALYDVVETIITERDAA